MKTYPVEKNEFFFDRTSELERLAQISAAEQSCIITVYGRRRIGKTELLEQAFRERGLLKFEGLEGAPESQQMMLVMQQLANYTDQPLYKEIGASHWLDVLTHIAKVTEKGCWTIYFEEVQWLANYQNHFISALKYVWDNFFRRNKQLIIILCGSSPSFMVNQVIKSKALYNRSQYDFLLRELNITTARKILNRNSIHEVMDAYLTCGGMPEYLLKLKHNNSIYLKLCEASFKPDAFFFYEYERIFTSSLAANKYYKKIIDFLSKRKFATRQEILNHLKIKSGGGISEVLNDLILCGFIEKYTPYNLAENSLLARYCITDAYLQFYFKFINPIKAEIARGDFEETPSQALNMADYQQWLGYAFERYCRKYQRQLAHLLGFSGVRYQVGAYYSRKTNATSPGYQIDLLFDRDDKVITLCEIKYKNSKISADVAAEIEKKIAYLPNLKHKRLQTVLISNYGPDDSLLRRRCFDAYITLEDLFKKSISEN